MYCQKAVHLFFSLQSAVFSLQPVLPRAEWMSGRGFIFGRTYGTLGTYGTDRTRQTSVSEVEPPEKRVLCTPRMRRNQKNFFHLVNRRAGAAPQKISRKKVCHSVSLCPISPISPICLRNAPAAPSDRPSQGAKHPFYWRLNCAALVCR